MKTIILEDWQVKNLREYFGQNDATQTSHWAFPIFDKAHKEAINDTHCCERFVRYNDLTTKCFTQNKKYRVLDAKDNYYMIVDDEGDTIWVWKKNFETLKDEEIPTFTDWLKDNGWKKTPSYYYYKKGGTTKERNLLIKMYQKEYYL